MSTYRSEIPFGGYEIDSMPGNHQVALCHSFYVSFGSRGQGHGAYLKKHQMETLDELGYDYALCTVRSDNEAQLKILSQTGWKIRDEFFDRRQGCDVQVWSWKRVE